MRLALNYRRVDPSKGGAETYVVDLATRLARLGHEVSLYAETWREGVLPSEVRTVRVQAPGRTRGARTWNFAVRSEAALRAAEADHDCTVGFINTWHHDILIPQGGVRAASIEANSFRFPEGWRRACYKLAKKLDPAHRLYRAIEARQYDPSRRTSVVAVSGLVQGHLERDQGVSRDRTRIIPNAIDADRLQVDSPGAVRREFRADRGLKPGDLVALFVGHNFWLKGLEPLLRALHLRATRDPNSRPIHLLVCGGGHLKPVRRLVADLGLGRTVHPIGFLDDVRSAFHASDFFASPTFYDPCSLVVFEALACGLPVITTACNGAGELMTGGLEGFVIPRPDDSRRLADALDRMAIDEDRTAMSEHARRLGRAQSFDRHVARLLELFEDVIAAKRGRTPHGARPSSVRSPASSSPPSQGGAGGGWAGRIDEAGTIPPLAPPF